MALASWFVFRGNLRERFGKPKGKPGDVRMPSQPISIDDFLRRLRDIESDKDEPEGQASDSLRRSHGRRAETPLDDGERP
jgi:hypothetical protein